jgi:membrane protein DedA with SNARE-associated domain
MCALVFALLGIVVWAGGATYVALAGVAVGTISSSTLLKAAAVLGAFIFFGYLVGVSEKLRWRERELDAEFERHGVPRVETTDS